MQMSHHLVCSDPLVDAARLEAGNTSSHTVSEEERRRICQQMCRMLDEDGVTLINRDNPSFCDSCTAQEQEPQTRLRQR